MKIISINCAVEISIDDLSTLEGKAIGNDNYFNLTKKLDKLFFRVDNLEYNGHFGNFVFFTVENKKQASQVEKIILNYIEDLKSN